MFSCLFDKSARFYILDTNQKHSSSFYTGCLWKEQFKFYFQAAVATRRAVTQKDFLFTHVRFCSQEEREGWSTEWP